MSAVDKFGRPLKSDPSDSRRSVAAVAEGIQLDKDKQYSARDKRIKSVADPADDTDAVNKQWVTARLEELHVNIEALVDQLRVQTNKLVGVIMTEVDNRIKGAALGEGVTEVSQDERDRYVISKKSRR